MDKAFIEIEMLKYLKANRETSYRNIRNYIYKLTEEERKKEVALTKRGESKIKKKRELISSEDLMVWEVLIDLITRKIITPITDFGDMDKSTIVVTDFEGLNKILNRSQAV